MSEDAFEQLVWDATTGVNAAFLKATGRRLDSDERADLRECLEAFFDKHLETAL